MKIVANIGKLLVIALSLYLLILNQTPSWAGDLFNMSIRDEIRIGADMYKEAQKKWGFVEGDEQLHIDIIGQALVKSNELKMFEKYTFTLLNDKTINAFATPGGYIYIHKGLYDLIKHDDNLIAAVLGHELGHSYHRHIRSQYHRAMNTQALIVLGAILSRSKEVIDYAPVLGDIYLLTYSRDNEYEADRAGSWFPAKAGYNPRGMIRVLQILQREPGAKNIEILASHPDISKRITRVETLIREQIEPDQKQNPHKYSSMPPDTKHLKIDRTGGKDATLKYPSEDTKSTQPENSNTNDSASRPPKK